MKKIKSTVEPGTVEHMMMSTVIDSAPHLPLGLDFHL